MNIQELQAYNLDDATKFNFRLNPKIWGQDEKLLPEVREKLLEIAEDFREFLGVPELDVQDITISGSNAAYAYTPKSDIDLHLVVKFPEGKQSEVYRELFDAKKYQYNDLFDYKIGDHDVELYVQDEKQPHHSAGIYSLLGNDWIQVPRRIKAEVEHSEVKDKYEDFGHRIEAAIKSGDEEQQEKLLKRLKDMRAAGLEATGEFGPENLAYKLLRSHGLIQGLFDAYHQAKSDRMSLEEKQRAEKKAKRFTYGYHQEQLEEVGSTPDGTNPSTCQDLNEVGSTPDGTNPSTCMDLNEDSPEMTLKKFIVFCVNELQLESLPTIKLRKDPQWPKVNRTFGRYNDEKKTLEVAWGQRHLMDIFRTVAHELTHAKQHEREAVPPTAGETGSEFENEANARAGILMRDWGQQHPELFTVSAEEVDDELIDEGLKDWGKKAAVGAMAAGALAGGMPQDAEAHSGSFGYYLGRSLGRALSQGPLAPVADAGRIVNNVRNITPAQLQGEMNQELYNYIRANGGDPHGQNKSQLYQWQRQMERDREAQLADNEPAATGYERDFRTDNPKPARARPLPGYVQQEIDESASGYIPTKKQAKDPRYVMALSTDIKPGALGKEANKLKLKTNSQGVPQIANANGLVETLALELASFKKKSINESVLDEEELDEVKMSPSALKKFANSPAAKGMKAGFEFEVCIPNTEIEDEDAEPEPDYDMDERAYTIDGVVDFFRGGDMGIGNREADILTDTLTDEYYQMQTDAAYESWSEDGQETFEEVVREHWEEDWDERVSQKLEERFVRDDPELFPESSEELYKRIDQVIRAGTEAPRFTKSSEQEEYKLKHPDYKLYTEISDEISDELDEYVEQEWGNNNNEYIDQARDRYIEDFMENDRYSQEDFFDQMGLRWMSDFEGSNYNLSWPYYSFTGGSNGGEYTIEDRADSLSEALGMPVEASYGYHSGSRGPKNFVMEPDTSVHPDNHEDAGLEIISPPLPIDQCVDMLKKVVEWCQENECYTNESTGLHMGVSLPDQKLENLDYVKLALFLGDEHVLDDFERSTNYYTKSVLKDLKNKVKNRDGEGVAELLDKMRTGLSKEASKALATSNPGKYSSINLKDKYVEFRSAGGDTLSRESREGIEFLENTLNRYVQAMAIAGDPEAHKKEYAKKLYKLLAPEAGESIADLFSLYSAGFYSKEEFKQKWAQAVLDKEKPEIPANWELVNKATGVREFYITDKMYADALQQAREEVGSRNLDQYILRKANAPAEFREYEIYDKKTGKVLQVIKGKTEDEVLNYGRNRYHLNPQMEIAIRPHIPDETESEPAPKKLSKRAELAQQIKKNVPKSNIGDEPADKLRKWEIVRRDNGEVVQILHQAPLSSAESIAQDWQRRLGVETYQRSVPLTPLEQMTQERTGNPF